MIRKISMAAIFLAASVYAGNLSFESGTIKAHTEVFGDSTIDPVAKKATSHLSMEDNPSTLKGSIEVSMGDLISDNKKRDVSMQETLEASAFPKAVFELKEVVSKGGELYSLKGNMTLHGVTKAVHFDGTIAWDATKVRIKAQSMIKMSDFGIKPPKMVFLTVRDQVDLSVNVSLKR